MSILTELLGISEKDFKSLKVFMQSIRVDFPIFQRRIEKIELQVYALSIYFQKQDPVIWRSSMLEASEKIKEMNNKMRGKY